MKFRLTFFLACSVLGLIAFVAPGVRQAQAAAPTLVAVGAQAASNNAVSPVWPTHQADDIGLMIIETANEAVVTIPAGWAQVAGSPIGTGGAATAGSTRLTVFWKRAASSAEATLSIGDSGNHQIARIITFRGVVTSGNPWDVTATGTLGPPAATSTAVSIPGATTTVDETLIVAIVSNVTDTNTAQTVNASWANASLTGVAEIADGNANVGNGGGFGVGTGVKAAAGLYNATTATLSTASYQARFSIALRPPRTTLGNGTDPANAAIGPGGAATMADAFTFQTAAGTDTIAAVQVGFAAGTAAGLSLVEITDDAGTTVYGSVADPTDTQNITLTTGITATTTLTQYKIRVTPKTHANMPAPAGSTYSVTAKINSWTSLGTKLGSDTAGTTVTIDNLSPGNVTLSSCTAGIEQVALSWTNPADGDFNSVIALRGIAAVADTPVEGATYAVGDLIGSSTVACVAASSPCTDSGLTAGTAYHYRLFARDSNGNYSATGVVPTGSPCTPASVVTSFNVVETGANAATGRIFTKIAGQDISVDIVALDASSAIATGFTGDVAVELVDNSGGGACASLPLIKTLSNQTFTVANSGRHPLSAGQFEANAYRNVKFRISYPTSSPTVTSCSADAFANRPAQFVTILVRDANRTTAGTTNTLNNTSNPGTGVVHNAGRPFRIDATAQNGAGTPLTTTLYTPDSGQPVAVLSQCGVAAVCPATPGTVTTTAAYSALNGVITNTTASYNDVGSFNLALEDQTFAAVDAGDGTSTAVRYIPSGAAVTVGRFVPDYFSLEAGSTITPRSDIGACSASTFTYMGERMTLGFTLKARDSANNVTPNYAGATLGALVLDSLTSYGFGAINSIAPTPLTARLDLSLAGATGSWSAGSAGVTVPLAVNRAAAPDGPYTSLKIGMAPGDPDGVTLQAAALNLDVDNSGTPESAQLGAAQTVRFGRLRLLNAYGSELLDVRLPVRAEYYTGTDFWTLNSSDNCTVVPSSSIALGNYLPPPAGTAVSAANMGVAPTDHRPAGDIVLAGGSATIVLAKPSPVATGSLDVVLNLGTGIVSPNSCVTGAFAGGTAASLQYLLGNWCGANYDRAPSARVKLGSPKAPFIYLRERY